MRLTVSPTNRNHRSMTAVGPRSPRGTSRAGSRRRAPGAIGLWLTRFALASITGGAIALAGAPAAHGALPFDHHPTAPTDSSQVRGGGYLLSDPLHTRTHTFWAGAYNTVPGARAYCIDEFYDYPRSTYGYRTTEVTAWGPRQGSAGGASARTVGRIAYIVNLYGQSPSRDVDAAVAVAVHRLAGAAGFQTEYQRYLLPQLRRLNPAVPTLIDRLLVESELLAGPYTTSVTFGPAPGVGGVGTVAISVRSARGYPLRHARVAVRATSGLALLSPRAGDTGPGGVIRLAYRALAAGQLRLSATGAGPASSLRLGVSPSHSGAGQGSGAQRVVLASAVPSRWTAVATGTVIVPEIGISTAVVGGTGARPIGDRVADRIDINGLGVGAVATLTARLIDATGVECGRWSRTVVGGSVPLTVTSAAMPACGRQRDTFVESLIDARGVLLAKTPPGSPTETFDLSPTVTSPATASSAPTGAPATQLPPTSSAPASTSPVASRPSSSTAALPSTASTTTTGQRVTTGNAVRLATPSVSPTPSSTRRFLARTGAQPQLAATMGLGILGAGCVLALVRRSGRSGSTSRGKRRDGR